MEIHPILEGDVNPGDNMWYVLSAFGDRPSLRVGHTAVCYKGRNGGEVIVIGGANPSESFLDVHTLDLTKLSWNMLSPDGFEARYEHISYIPDCHPHKIYVLSGANQEGNLSSVQIYDIEHGEWNTVKASGSAPAPRTHHSTAASGDCVYLFSGGKCGADPVQDRQVYCFNAQASLWSSLSVCGESPAPRHGHSLCVFGTKLICFGGMAGAKFYNDLHVLDLDKGVWSSAKFKRRNQPEPRASHAAVVHNKTMYVFGGMNKEGMALDDLWKMDLTLMQWSLITIEGPPPTSRLDMACCLIEWKWSSDSSADKEPLTTGAANTADAEKSSVLNDRACTMLLIHGGMDTQGEIFDDCVVLRLDD